MQGNYNVSLQSHTQLVAHHFNQLQAPPHLLLHTVQSEEPRLTLNPGFPFQILSHSFGEKSENLEQKAWVRS